MFAVKKIRLIPLFLEFLFVYGAFFVSPLVSANSNAQVPSALHADNYIRAKTLLERTIAKEIPKRIEARKSWYRALFALISLERLVGSQEKGQQLFARCQEAEKNSVNCRSVVSESEWRAMLDWACRGETRPAPCEN